jgi:hypothetical protein
MRLILSSKELRIVQAKGDNRAGFGNRISNSNGTVLFLMAVKKDERGRNVHEQIRGTIEGW